MTVSREVKAWRMAPAEPPEPTRRVVVIDRPSAVQTEIRVGHLAMARTHADYLTFDLAVRIWPLILGVAVLLGLTETPGPTVVTILVIASAVVGRVIGAFSTRRWLLPIVIAGSGMAIVSACRTKFTARPSTVTRFTVRSSRSSVSVSARPVRATVSVATA